MIATSLLLSLLFLIPTPTDVTVVQFPAKGKVNLSLGAKNKAEIERVGSVTHASIQMEGLQLPQTARPGMNAYVVWAISPEGLFDNLGELEIEGNKGTLESTTQFDRFAILITAEPHYMVDKASTRIVYRNEASRELTNLPLKVEVGAYDYADLPPAVAGVPSLVIEARAALSIAAAAGAAQRAESEYRQARVALDTMEELLKRGSSPDVVASAAHATIRRAQIAVTAARQTLR